MKRDIELVRKILLFFEDRDVISIVSDKELVTMTSSMAVSRRELEYHFRIMAQANLLTVETVKSSTSDRTIRVMPIELTWEGHEFLQLSRQEKIWRKVAKRVGGEITSLTFEMIKILLLDEMKRRIGV